MRILVLGCGNAEFSEDLYDAGYKNVINVDISSVVID
jgi:EEF1A lysine methyltransferase 4